MEPDPFYFHRCYYLINSSSTYYPSYKKSEVCRYCGKSAPEVTFNQVTHLIPELLGRNNIHTFDECDRCNLAFSGLEGNLAIFFRPYITMLGIEGKRSVPSFQSRSIDRDELTRTSVSRSGSRVRLEVGVTDDYVLNREDKTLDIVFRKPLFVPVKIYKALVKIGLSLLPTECDGDNKETFDWLLGDTNDLGYINRMFTTTLVRKYFKQPKAELYRTIKVHDRSREWPEYTLLVYFANQVIQIFLPFSRDLQRVHSRTRTLEINLFADHFWYDEKPPKEIMMWDIGISHSITQDHRMSLSFQGIESSESNDEIS